MCDEPSPSFPGSGPPLPGGDVLQKASKWAPYVKLLFPGLSWLCPCSPSSSCCCLLSPKRGGQHCMWVCYRDMSYSCVRLSLQPELTPGSTRWPGQICSPTQCFSTGKDIRIRLRVQFWNTRNLQDLHLPSMCPLLSAALPVPRRALGCPQWLLPSFHHPCHQMSAYIFLKSGFKPQSICALYGAKWKHSMDTSGNTVVLCSQSHSSLGFAPEFLRLGGLGVNTQGFQPQPWMGQNGKSMHASAVSSRLFSSFLLVNWN